MAKCEKCYHKPICIYNAFNVYNNSLENEECEHFKDKDLIAELPCRIDDTVYSLGYQSIMVLTVSHISLIPYPVVECEDIECEEYAGTYQFETKDFGKTVFLSFGEATKALKKQQKL